MEKYEFKTKQEIADYIGITRRVLYYRADKYNIDLNGSLTEQNIVQLCSENVPNENNKKKLQDLKDRLHLDDASDEQDLNDQNILNMYKQSIEDLKNTIAEQKELLNQQSVQLSNKDEQIKDASEQFAKLADQQQQLQLVSNKHIAELEQKMDDQNLLLNNSEHNKGFWYKLFH